MKNLSFRTALFTLGTCASVLGVAASALASEVLVSVDGSKQGRLAGETVKGTDKKFVALSLSYEVKSPRDVASGQASGKRQHGLVCVRKTVGAASPQLFQAVVTNEVLKSVLFEFQRTAADGRPEIYHTIKLTNATAASYRVAKEQSAGKEVGNASDLEEVCFSFQKIEIENKTGKTMASDDWQGGAEMRRK